MPKQIIILTQSDHSAVDAAVTITGIYWLAVVAGQEIGLPTFTSAWSGVSAPETAALQAGSVIEVPFAKNIIFGASNATVKALLLAEFNGLQAAQAAKSNPRKYYGIFYDGAAWSA